MPIEFDEINCRLSKALSRLALIRKLAEDKLYWCQYSNYSYDYECGITSAVDSILRELDDQEEIEKKGVGDVEVVNRNEENERLRQAWDLAEKERCTGERLQGEDPHSWTHRTINCLRIALNEPKKKEVSDV